MPDCARSPASPQLLAGLGAAHGPALVLGWGGALAGEAASCFEPACCTADLRVALGCAAAGEAGFVLDFGPCVRDCLPLLDNCSCPAGLLDLLLLRLADPAVQTAYCQGTLLLQRCNLELCSVSR